MYRNLVKLVDMTCSVLQERRWEIGSGKRSSYCETVKQWVVQQCVVVRYVVSVWVVQVCVASEYVVQVSVMVDSVDEEWVTQNCVIMGVRGGNAGGKSRSSR